MRQVDVEGRDSGHIISEPPEAVRFDYFVYAVVVYDTRLTLWVLWTRRALRSLQDIQGQTGQKNKLLIENINYSPIFLETFWNLGLCGFCLDMGHLMLGGESVIEVTEQFISVTGEVHLHGVIGYEEHLCLAAVPAKRVSKWLKLLLKSFYGGVVNLEVFSQADLEASIRMLSDLISRMYEDRGI